MMSERSTPVCSAIRSKSTEGPSLAIDIILYSFRLLFINNKNVLLCHNVAETAGGFAFDRRNCAMRIEVDQFLEILDNLEQNFLIVTEIQPLFNDSLASVYFFLNSIANIIDLCARWSAPRSKGGLGRSSCSVFVVRRVELSKICAIRGGTSYAVDISTSIQLFIARFRTVFVTYCFVFVGDHSQTLDEPTLGLKTLEQATLEVVSHRSTQASLAFLFLRGHQIHLGQSIGLNEFAEGSE